MFDCPSMEQNKVENFRAFIYVFLPLGLSCAPKRRLAQVALGRLLARLLLLGCQILQQVCEPLIFDV